MTVGIWYVQALVGRTYIFIRVGHQYIIWIPHDSKYVHGLRCGHPVGSTFSM